jgi:hypothetical protein
MNKPSRPQFICGRPAGMTARALATVIVGVMAAPGMSGQDGGRSREYRLGADLSTVSALAHVEAADAKAIHLRPALMQEVEWQRGYSSAGPAAQSDTVRRIVFSFYNDQLSRLVVDYDRDRTLGMTDADMVEGLANVYGPAPKQTVVRPAAGRVASRIEQESGVRVAGWGDGDYSVVLYRSYDAGFRLIVSSTRLESLARAADARAIELDVRDAPRLEMARQKEEAEAIRVAQAKARETNKGAFRP